MLDFSDEQKDAFGTITEWWNNGSPEKQELLLFGYAGVGKTTLAKHLPELLGLRIYDAPERTKNKEDAVYMQREASKNAILYCAFTGKAASVLRRKGLNAYTIHQSIYGTPIFDQDECNQLADAAAVAKAEGRFDDYRKIGDKLRKLLQPDFGLSERSKAYGCSLIVVDECSMIDEKLYRDLIGTEIPIIFMGDPAQLPPVGKSAGLIERNPEILLTHIHRQAAGNPILELATHLRTSPLLPKMKADGLLVTNDRFPVQSWAHFDQIIVGYHTTRRAMNGEMRRHLGFNVFPDKGGEKLINLKNMHGLGLMNGEMVKLENFNRLEEPNVFTGSLLDFETGLKLGNAAQPELSFYDGYFLDTISYVKGRVENDWRLRKEMAEIDWGYAITGHKSQGSEWDNVFIYDDGFGRSDLDRQRWLYTTLTRARKSAIICSRFAV